MRLAHRPSLDVAVVLAVLNTLPGINKLASILGLVRFAEARAASVAMCGNFKAHDVALSLLRMVSNNIGHISCMCAQQYGLPHIVFGGSFIRDHPYTIATISSGVRFYSRGAVQVRATLARSPPSLSPPPDRSPPPPSTSHSLSPRRNVTPSAAFGRLSLLGASPFWAPLPFGRLALLGASPC